VYQIDSINNKTWFPSESLPNIAGGSKPIKTIKFNIGGQSFEASEGVLKRDPDSLLASLCDSTSPLDLKEDGVVYFDRDW